MNDINGFDPVGKTPSELEQHRRDVIALFTTKYKGYDDPELPVELLHHLAIITQTLRRKNAGPPRRAATRRTQRPTVEDL